jgi:hypothetical protein
MISYFPKYCKYGLAVTLAGPLIVVAPLILMAVLYKLLGTTVLTGL